jgi:hypothetical protein
MIRKGQVALVAIVAFVGGSLSASASSPGSDPTGQQGSGGKPLVHHAGGR